MDDEASLRVDRGKLLGFSLGESLAPYTRGFLVIPEDLCL